MPTQLPHDTIDGEQRHAKATTRAPHRSILNLSCAQGGLEDTGHL